MVDKIKKILEVDYSQIELRVASLLAKGIEGDPLPIVKRKSDPDMQYIKPSVPDEPDGCLGYWSGFDPRDFDCEYEFAGRMTCEECIFGVCGGTKDPRLEFDKE